MLQAFCIDGVVVEVSQEAATRLTKPLGRTRDGREIAGPLQWLRADKNPVMVRVLEAQGLVPGVALLSDLTGAETLDRAGEGGMIVDVNTETMKGVGEELTGEPTEWPD